jgi:hypothetical protein
VIDYYEAQGKSLAEYARVLLSDKPYRYSEHLLPHDAGARELGTAKSCGEMLTALNMRPVRVLSKLPVMDGINAVRLLLSRAYFDRDKCNRLLRALEHYAADWDEGKKTFALRPRQCVEVMTGPHTRRMRSAIWRRASRGWRLRFRVDPSACRCLPTTSPLRRAASSAPAPARNGYEITLDRATMTGH